MSKLEKERESHESEIIERAKGEFEKKDKAAIRRIGEILKDTDTVQYIYVESLGCRVPYKPLKVEHLQMLREKKEDVEVSTTMLYLMLKGGDDSVSMEDVKKIPLDVATEMITKMAKGFLLTK